MFKIVSNTDHPGGCGIEYSIKLVITKVQQRQEKCDYSFNSAQIIITLDDTVETAKAKWQKVMDYQIAVHERRLARKAQLVQEVQPYTSPFDGRIK
jgi:hypothetical protein